jgi:uncharacterized protein GlcG (DUF336 family)
MNITLEEAEKIIAIAKQKAIELKTKMNITVVDSGANIVAFSRMDGCLVGLSRYFNKESKNSPFF